ncbi:MAG TPA: gliding motility lipoprotein GldB [Ohtaekwangia sp.]|nr:gliding motility lipoprotein GldB [Ohtaekwangia sp.]
MLMQRYAFFLIVLFFFSGCGDQKENECVVVPDTEGIRVDVNFEQFHDSLANLSSKQELVDLFSRQPVLRDVIFRRGAYPDDSVFINKIYSRLQNPHIDTLLAETNRIFGDLSDLENQFEEAFRNLKHYYPSFNPPKIQTVISGLDTDMFVSDSLIIVGLDYYLGNDARFRPQVYDYQLRKYDPNDIVPSLLLIYGINDSINKTDLADKTVLADMIAYGKSFYFAKHMLPCVADSVFIWYTPEEINGSRKNQDLIWARFIESQVLYSTSHMVKKDYLAERPITVQVGEKCPGRIGQWVGWQIVKKYMDTHPDRSLQQLMAAQDAQQLFKESNYKPRKR